MNDTVKHLIPHVYLLLAFIMAFSAVQQAIAFADQYHSYLAILEWLVFLAILFAYRNHRDNSQ